jgi:hypothetical protein
MEKEKNIGLLSEQLQSLGFPGNLECALRFYYCLGLSQFTLLYREIREENILRAGLCFQKDENQLDYALRFYELTLRKKIEIPHLASSGLTTKSLEERMKLVDWNFPFLTCPVLESSTGQVLPKELLGNVEAILADLQTLCQNEEGTLLAEKLKMKFWANTGMEQFIQNFRSSTAQHEITQRFYMFKDAPLITLSKAYHYLCLRWEEKKINVHKKIKKIVVRGHKGR